MFSKLKIGEMAELNNVSVQTLRYYEQMGLITPYIKDSATNYRYYHINQSARLDLIQFLKNINFSLSEIQEVLNHPQQFDIEQLLIQKEAELTAELRQARSKLELIHSFQESNTLYQQNVKKNTIEFLNFPKRLLYCYPIERNIYEMTIHEYEYYLRLFKQHLTEIDYPVLFNRVGSVLEKEQFMAGNFQSKLLCIMASTLEKLPQNNYVLAKGTYAVTYCDAFEKELATMADFREELLTRGYRITSDYICEVIYELPQSSKDRREMFIRLQVRVEENKT